MILSLAHSLRTDWLRFAILRAVRCVRAMRRTRLHHSCGDYRMPFMSLTALVSIAAAATAAISARCTVSADSLLRNRANTIAAPQMIAQSTSGQVVVNCAIKWDTNAQRVVRSQTDYAKLYRVNNNKSMSLIAPEPLLLLLLPLLFESMKTNTLHHVRRSIARRSYMIRPTDWRVVFVTSVRRRRRFDHQ